MSMYSRTPRVRTIGTLILAALATVASPPSGSAAGAKEDVAATLADLATRAATAEKAGRAAIAGADGWLFFVAELRALSVGPFWGERAAAVSRATNKAYADPLAAIVDFHDQLTKAGIELVVVPVPAKAAIYPDLISERLKGQDPARAPRLDPNHEQFYRLLGERGVKVLDLTGTFQAGRRAGGPALYCKTDSHWSGRGIDLAARAIAELVADRPWLKAAPKLSLETEGREVAITGDLARMIDEANPVRETLPLTVVGRREGGTLAPVEPSRSSPVLLMGDSHTLVFHDPALFARGAGLPDHLAIRLGVPVDLVGIRGSGATTTRIELIRRRDNLRGKKLVVWCFSCREFTESGTGWRKVPVIR